MSRITAVLLLAASAAAQSVVLPSSVAAAPPRGSTFSSSLVFYSTPSPTIPHDSRSQLIYATSDVKAPFAQWQGISFRRPMGAGGTNAAFTAKATIVMSLS
jgi:hypothetical protein